MAQCGLINFAIAKDARHKIFWITDRGEDYLRIYNAMKKGLEEELEQ
jgi:predicted transcriptional regulator